MSGWKCCLLRLAASSGAAFSRAAFSPKHLQGGGSSSGGGSGSSSGGRSGHGGRQQGEELPTCVTLEQVRLCYLEKAAQKGREGGGGVAAQLVVEAYAEVVDAEHASPGPVAIAYPIGRDSGRDLVDRGDVKERGVGGHSKGRCPVDRAVGGCALVPRQNREGQEQGAGGGSSGAAGGGRGGEGGEGVFCLALARQPGALGEDLCKNSSNGGHRPVCVCLCVHVCVYVWVYAISNVTLPKAMCPRKTTSLRMKLRSAGVRRSAAGVISHCAPILGRCRWWLGPRNVANCFVVGAETS